MIILTALLVSTSSTSTAGYTLKDCLRLAMEHNVDLEEALAEIRIREADLSRAKGGRWPRVDYYQIAGAVNEARGDAVFSPDSTTNYLDGLGPFTRLDLRITQPIYSFGRISAGIRAAEKGVATSQAEREEKRAKVLFDVKELYYNLLLNRKLSAELGEIRDAVEKALATANERLAEGSASVTQSDLLEIEYALEGVKQELARVEDGAALATSALRHLIGLPRNEPFEIASSEQLDEVAFEVAALTEYQERALKERPELRRLEDGIAAKEAQIEEARAAMFPTIFAMGLLRYAVAPNRTDQKNPFVWDEFNYLDPGVILGLRWEFSAESLAKLDKAKAKHERVLVDKKRAVEGIRLEVERAFREVTTSKALLDVARRRRTLARNMAVLAATNYELGVGEARPLLDALERRTRSTSELYVAIRNYNIAIARLTRAAGLTARPSEGIAPLRGDSSR